MPSQDNLIKAMENWANIYLFRSLSAYFDYLKITGVSMQQAYALTLIHYNGPRRISEISEHMMVSAAAASQMVDRLEKRGLVERTANPGDRRVRTVILSDEGKSFVVRSIQARQSWAKEIPTELSEVQMEEISAALQLLTLAYQE